MVTIKRTLTIFSEKKSTLDLPLPESDSKVRESVAQDLDPGERSNSHDVDPVKSQDPKPPRRVKRGRYM
ncbi:hypothetical protein Bca4012_083054 [Brassica carinata]|uniref:Uncharacterized protein n=1 Tax=Brassica carinata TaxID=52824 RepID=A0A8X7VB14_BRACI|nr:hypothetical protein Bca52824_027744 [Brassica carinata]